MVKVIRSFTLEPEISRALDAEATRLHANFSPVLQELIREALAARSRTRTQAIQAAVYAGLGTTALVVILTASILIG